METAEDQRIYDRVMRSVPERVLSLDQLGARPRASLMRLLQGTGRIPVLARRDHDLSRGAVFHVCLLGYGLAQFSTKTVAATFCCTFFIAYAVLGLVRYALHRRRAYRAGDYLVPTHMLELWADRLRMRHVRVAVRRREIWKEAGENEVLVTFATEPETSEVFELKSAAEAEACLALLTLGCAAHLKPEKDLVDALDPLQDAPEDAGGIGDALAPTMPISLVYAAGSALIVAAAVTLAVGFLNDKLDRERAAAERIAEEKRAADAAKKAEAERFDLLAARYGRLPARDVRRQLFELGRAHRVRTGQPLGLPVVLVPDEAAIARAEVDAKRGLLVESCFTTEARREAAQSLCDRVAGIVGNTDWREVLAFEIGFENVGAAAKPPRLVVHWKPSVPAELKGRPVEIMTYRKLEHAFSLKLEAPDADPIDMELKAEAGEPAHARSSFLGICLFRETIDNALDRVARQVGTLFGVEAPR